MPLAFDPNRAAQPPRDYQIELTQALVNETTPFKSGDKILVEVATGGGKRRILNDFLAARVLAAGARALVVTKDWPLVLQNADDLVARHDGALERIGFVGDRDAAKLFHPVTYGAAASIVYTTIQTWHARKDRNFVGAEFDVVCIDESHWGEHGALYTALFRRYASATFVGTTATPRKSSGFRRVGPAYPFMALVDRGFLARPEVRTVRTNIDWAPAVASCHSDFLPSSLVRLGDIRARNELIVSTYLGDAATFGKTIMFACSIEHATVLAAMLREKGVAAAALHSKLLPEQRQQVMGDFVGSGIAVLANMAMLTHGIDIPDVRSIFLARPTRSDILFSQMIGRGARKAEGKEAFFIVDFSDNVETHGLYAIHAEGFLGSRISTNSRRCPPISAHSFEPAEFIVLQDEPGYEELAGLEIQPEQTFGIEFEAAPRSGTRFRYSPVARRLLDALRPVVPTARSPLEDVHIASKDNTVWNAEPDCSCGLEVTSRILRGEDGMREVVDACKVVAAGHAETGLTADSRKVGTHVHLGAKLAIAQLKNLVIIVAHFEPALMSLVAPSRAETRFVRTTRRLLHALLRCKRASDLAQLLRRNWKCSGLNPEHLAAGGYGTVEIRYHSGTIDAAKILQWVSLWMRILNTLT
jgi:superfamily II DNA or RNA helicase